MFILIFCAGCHSNETLDIYIENGSLSQKTIPLEIYLDGKLVKEVDVTRKDNIVSSKHVQLLLPETNEVKLIFKIPQTEWKTECVFKKGELSKKTWIHVALSELEFKKGYQYMGRTLERDTVVERKFYCELVDSPISGQIEE